MLADVHLKVTAFNINKAQHGTKCQLTSPECLQCLLPQYKKLSNSPTLLFSHYYGLLFYFIPSIHTFMVFIPYAVECQLYIRIEGT